MKTASANLTDVSTALSPPVPLIVIPPRLLRLQVLRRQDDWSTTDAYTTLVRRRNRVRNAVRSEPARTVWQLVHAGVVVTFGTASLWARHTLKLNPLEPRGNYSAMPNNMKLVHWPLMGEMLPLVQRGGDWSGPQPAQSPPRCTKCNSPPINGLCTNHCIAVLLCSFNVGIKELTQRLLIHSFIH